MPNLPQSLREHRESLRELPQWTAELRDSLREHRECSPEHRERVREHRERTRELPEPLRELPQRFREVGDRVREPQNGTRELRRGAKNGCERMADGWTTALIPALPPGGRSNPRRLKTNLRPDWPDQHPQKRNRPALFPARTLLSRSRSRFLPDR